MKLVPSFGCRAESQRNKAQVAAQSRRLAEQASIEATPRQLESLPAIQALLPLATRVYVPLLPGAAFADTLGASRRLLNEGMVPVPHVPVRALESRDQLRHWLAELAALGVTELLLIAGDSEAVAGPFKDTLAVLESGILKEEGFSRLGIAGHPEGHPSASAAELEAAMATKARYARDTATQLWVVTQFVFDPDAATAWLARQAQTHPELPVYLGLAGPARLKTLLAYAAQCGVGVSTRALRRNPQAARLLGGWHPERLVRALVSRALEVEGAASPLQGLHLFPFGGLETSARWLASLREASPRPPLQAHS